MNKLYIVRWEDAWGNGSAYYKEGNDYTPVNMLDVGWVMEENNETIVLCSCHCPDDGEYRHVKVIPWKYVVSMEELV